MSLLRISERRTPLAAQLTQSISSCGLWGLFNPSLLRHDDGYFCAVRSLGPGGRPPMHAHLLKLDHAGQVLGSPTNLTEIAQAQGLPIVADPKLLRLAGEVWMTFNTGYVNTGHNEIFLQRLTPTPGPAMRCEFPNRRRIEKNWGFFERNGKRFAVYSLNPLTILEVTSELDGLTDVVLTVAYQGALRPNEKDLTLGSQPQIRDNELHLIAHEKIAPWKRRAYLGRPVRLTQTHPGGDWTAEVSSIRLLHSFKSLLGGQPRYNPNLLFCTYFSGLEFNGSRVLLSYGVNDLAGEVAELDEQELWA